MLGGFVLGFVVGDLVSGLGEGGAALGFGVEFFISGFEVVGFISGLGMGELLQVSTVGCSVSGREVDVGFCVSISGCRVRGLVISHGARSISGFGVIVLAVGRRVDELAGLRVGGLLKGFDMGSSASGC